ncbi:MAG: BrnT family toxin [Candidatus Acidiferrales bacterium]
MRFDWDEDKNRRNLAKHKVSFETAKLVFDDPRAVSRLDRVEDDEERWQTLGLVDGIVVLLVAHTYRDNDGEELIRIISARKATAHERMVYEQGG